MNLGECSGFGDGFRVFVCSRWRPFLSCCFCLWYILCWTCCCNFLYLFLSSSLVVPWRLGSFWISQALASFLGSSCWADLQGFGISCFVITSAVYLCLFWIVLIYASFSLQPHCFIAVLLSIFSLCLKPNSKPTLLLFSSLSFQYLSILYCLLCINSEKANWPREMMPWYPACNTCWILHILSSSFHAVCFLTALMIFLCL